MPDGLKRYHDFEHDHFITFSCFSRLPYLNTDFARITFETMLEACRQRYCFAVYAYVIMPEHVHLLISKPRDGTLASAINVYSRAARLRDVVVGSGNRELRALRC